MAATPAAKKPRRSPPEAVAYPGDEGSLSHIAALKFFESYPQTQFLPVDSFPAVFEKVESGEALYGVVPIENSASGTLHKTYDLLLKYDVLIGGELGVQENYCLCTRAGVQLQAVRSVLSHPNILEACSAFTEQRLAREELGPAGLKVVPCRSTTEAAQRVAAAGQASSVEAPEAAAIATREAAARYGLSVIAEGIGNDAFLETRYILIHSRSEVERPSPLPPVALNPVRKHSACFALRNEPGAIFRLISCWALRGIDVLKVETRPLNAGHHAPPDFPANTPRLWDYLFYVDYAVPPGQTEEASAKLWAALEEFSLWRRDLGVYSSHLTRDEKRPQTWSEMVDLMAKG